MCNFNFLNIFYLAIKYGPDAIHLISEIYELIKKAPKSEHQAYKKELDQAHKHYKVEKNRDYLRELRDRLKEKV